MIVRTKRTTRKVSIESNQSKPDVLSFMNLTTHGLTFRIGIFGLNFILTTDPGRCEPSGSATVDIESCPVSSSYAEGPESGLKEDKVSLLEVCPGSCVTWSIDWRG